MHVQLAHGHVAFAHVCASRESDAAFVALLDACRPSGGLARADELLARWRAAAHDGAAPTPRLAHWIAGGHALSFRWANAHWLPRFQFEWPRAHLRPGMAPVLAELQPLLEPWELAQWFTTPNGWLRQCTPAETLRSDWRAVRDAARADRFSLRG